MHNKTFVGRFFEKRSISATHVADKAGISPQRMTELTDTDHYPYALEIKLIALATDISPAELFEYLCKDVRLPPLEPQSSRG